MEAQASVSKVNALTWNSANSLMAICSLSTKFGSEKEVFHLIFKKKRRYSRKRNEADSLYCTNCKKIDILETCGKLNENSLTLPKVTK